MRKILFSTVLLSALISSRIWAHGEEIIGPHQGFIQMPGGFHTELVITKSALEIYLIDIDFKNPTIKNSSVEAQLKMNSKSKPVFLTCLSREDKFVCSLPKGFNPKKGLIEIHAKRDGMDAGVATYELPLKR